jgi:hypothetical protein
MGHINRFDNLDHKSASKTFRYALTLGDADSWLGAINVFRLRLNEHELVSAGFAFLEAQNPENAMLTAEAVLGQQGTPLPPLLSKMDESIFWANIAEPEYINACVLAGYNRMPGPYQVAFIDYVNGRAAA